ncbi:GDSL esterase/lipase At1g29670-like [Ziziphus jujuba]|uniref:GDSL esterase/lipase At1g29670-like n=1 Tax=Ziziphus jujuba TaxID=326968 RepID=A0ABM4AHZ0_ZIZJJ|nr:GDSL esterase/lipase At1g29670-like [Ziziphus jujuba]
MAEYLPVPFASATSRADILKGANYTSGAAGTRDESGYTEGARISLNLQLLNHKIIVARIVQILGNKELAAQHLSKCIYLVGIGTNDYANNYFRPQFYSTSRLFTPERYSIVLIQQLRLQLQTLYNLAARKLALSRLGLIGCTPYEVATYGTNGCPCVDNINNAVQLFNARLRSLVDDLNANFTNTKSIYINNYEIQSSTIASSGNLIVRNASCCAVAAGQVLCIPFGNTCANRNEYVY